jgi:hypothetical protein
MGDPFPLRGTKTARDKILSSLCLHIATVGITMAGRKAVRGPDLEWIGVLFQLRVAEGAILTTINEKIAKEISAESQELLKKSMVPSKRRRSLTGRLAWAAGAVPRTRWTVSTLYAVLRVRRRASRAGQSPGAVRKGQTSGPRTS